MPAELYEIQHFGFSAEQVTLERQYLLKQLLEGLLRQILETLGAGEDTSRSLDKKKAGIIDTIQSNFQCKLQEIERSDDHNFAIPHYVLLSQDFEQTKKYAVDSSNHLDAEVFLLKKRFLENSIMIAALEMEINQYEQIKIVLREEQEVHNVLQDFNETT